MPVADRSDALIDAARRRLAIVTLGLLALLVLGIGIVTAVAGLRALDDDVDRALESTASAALARLEGALPTASRSGESESESESVSPAESDTFLLYLDPKGRVVSNPAGISLSGLPAVDALPTGGPTDRDLRTVSAGGVDIRVLTLPIARQGGNVVGYVQAGFVLTLDERQSMSLVGTIAVVGLLGLLGAGIVTIVVTRRALVPIRRTLEAQRRFVADASHELRTPTALIRSTAEVLQREAHVDAEGSPLLADIVAESDRMGRLVGDLLTLAASSAAPMVLDRQPVDLVELARDTVRRTEPLAAERDVVLALKSAGPVSVAVDPVRIVQLLVILLDNAIDHSPQSGTVTVSVERAGRAAVLNVIDTGPGVPVADRERIFEPFERLHSARRDRSAGTGLGLAIARRIVAAHGGSIGVDDAPGGGARFTVRLPQG